MYWRNTLHMSCHLWHTTIDVIRCDKEEAQSQSIASPLMFCARCSSSGGFKKGDIIMETCPACKGKGYGLGCSDKGTSTYKMKCDNCGGTGRVSKVWTKEEWDHCRHCVDGYQEDKSRHSYWPDGTVRGYAQVRCTTCGGTQRVKIVVTYWYTHGGNVERR